MHLYYLPNYLYLFIRRTRYATGESLYRITYNYNTLVNRTHFPILLLLLTIRDLKRVLPRV